MNSDSDYLIYQIIPTVVTQDSTFETSVLDSSGEYFKLRRQEHPLGFDLRKKDE